MLKTKRVYEERQADDGTRILVDRLWPRGIRSAEAGIDQWMKDLAPSTDLRLWFGHKVERWPEFRLRYLEELSAPGKAGIVDQIASMALEGNVTLVYAAKDTEHNNAKVLEELISKLMQQREENMKLDVGSTGPEKLIAQVVRMADLVDYQDGSVVSREIINRKTGTVTVFAFDQGQGLSEHTAPFDALVYILDGQAEITISGKALRLKEGEMVIMPANHPHALKALGKFKMLLIMIKS